MSSATSSIADTLSSTLTNSDANVTSTTHTTAQSTIPNSTTTISPGYTATSVLSDLNDSEEVIDDNDPRVIYNGDWVQELNANVSLHDALTAGPSLTVSFFGSGIHVIGVVHAGQPPIIAQYTIDSNFSGSETREVAGSAANIIDQEYYSILNLSLAQHNLTINVTDFVQNNTRLYSIDSFVVERPRALTTSFDHKHSLGRREIGAIVGSVLGAVTLVILLLVVVRRCRRAKVGRGPDTMPRPLLVRTEKPPQPDLESIQSHDDNSTPEPRNYMEPWTKCFGFEFRRAHDV